MRDNSTTRGLLCRPICCCSDRWLDIGAGTMWNIEGSLPVVDPNQLLELAVLDGTGE